MKILANSIKCKKCGDVIYSAHRHDYVTCSCGECFVDGGQAYLRQGAKSLTSIEELNITMEDDLYDNCIEQIKWGKDTGRNSMGILCAVARAIRDSGYEINKKRKWDEVEDDPIIA